MPTAAPGTLPCLVFEVDHLRLAIPADIVQEVVRAVAIVSLPQAPPIVEGAINLRGEIVPVLDLRHRFQLPPQALSPDQHFVLAQAARRLVALRVDRASEVVAIPQASIISPRDAVPGTQYLAGIAVVEEGLLVIHDLDSLLALEEVGQIGQALAAAANPS